MTRKTRRIFFYILVLLFLLITPLVLAYSFGYKIDLAKKSLTQTGGIFIKSKIKRVSIFLDGTFVKETSFLSGGALLTEIQPGTHLLRIEKAEHQPWFKTVQVRPAVVEELRSIILTTQPVKYATSSLKEITSLLATSTSPWKLQIDKKNNLIVRQGKNQKTIAKNVNTFGLIGSKVFFIDKNGFLAKHNLDSGETETLGRPGFFLSEKLAQFVGSPTGDLIIIDSADGAFLLDTSLVVKPIGSGVKKAQFDSGGEKALLVKETSIDILWMADSKYQPFQKKGTLETILKLDSPVRDAGWFYEDEEHVLILSANGLFLIEIDGRGGRNTVELISGKINEVLTSPLAPSTILFKKNKTWFKIEI